MDVLIFLIPVAIFLGFIALCAFLWALKNGQFDDLEGASNRILFDDEEENLPTKKQCSHENKSQKKVCSNKHQSGKQ